MRKPTGRWTLHVQIMSMRQDNEILKLLHFPGGSFRPTKSKLSAYRWAEGRSFRSTPVTVASFIQSMAGKVANELALTLRFDPSPVADTGLAITGVTGLLHVSPTNSLWGPTRGYDPKARVDKRRRRAYEHKHTALKLAQVTAANGQRRLASSSTKRLPFTTVYSLKTQGL